MNTKNPTVLAALVLVVTIVLVVTGAVFFLNDKASAPADTSKVNSSNNQQSPNPADPNSPTKSNNTTTPQSSSPTATTVAPSNVSSITISSTALTPSEVSIKKGTAITWTNKDTSNHALALDGSANTQASQNFHSPQLKPNESYTYTFAATGTYRYKDVIAPALTGTVTVTE